MSPLLSRIISPRCMPLMMMTSAHQREWVALSLKIPQAPTPRIFPTLLPHDGTTWKALNNWTPLKNHSTVHLYINPTLLYNICQESEQVDVHSSGGTNNCDTEGTLPNFGDVCFSRMGSLTSCHLHSFVTITMCHMTTQCTHLLSRLQKRISTFIAVTVAYTTKSAPLGSVQYWW